MNEVERTINRVFSKSEMLKRVESMNDSDFAFLYIIRKPEDHESQTVFACSYLHAPNADLLTRMGFCELLRQDLPTS